VHLRISRFSKRCSLDGRTCEILRSATRCSLPNVSRPCRGLIFEGQMSSKLFGMLDMFVVRRLLYDGIYVTEAVKRGMKYGIVFSH